MKPLRALFLLALFLPLAACASHHDPLPSWNDTPTKDRITSFVDRVTDERSPDFVPANERIAVFDNDGTLWGEQPAYFQLLFAIDRVRALAPQYPEWRTTQPFRAVLENDMQGLAAGGHEGIAKIIAVSHSGMTTDEFRRTVQDWLATARHPTTGRPYTAMVYQPMLELLDHLRNNGFKTFIVSGGGIEFVRVFSEQVYGIPPEQVVGSTGVVTFELRDDIPALIKQPAIDFIDDKAGKPVAINKFIGRRPIAAFGNSDGDLQMLQYTTIPRDRSDTTPRLGVIIHHTDPDREFAYDRDSHIGKLDNALDEAPQRGWIIIDMARDWKVIYPPSAQ